MKTVFRFTNHNQSDFCKSLRCWLLSVAVVMAMNTSSIRAAPVPVTMTTGEEMAQVPTDWTIEMYPNPMVDIELCGNNETSWVCDPNRLVTQDEASQLMSDTYFVHENTSVPVSPQVCNDSRPIIAFALMHRMMYSPGSYPDNDKKKTQFISKFAFGLLNKWNFGGACGTDAVVVLSRYDRKVWTAVGSTAKKRLTDQCVNWVYGQVRSYFSRGEYYNGFKAMLAKYKEILSQDDNKCGRLSPGAIAGIVIGTVAGVGLLITLIGLACRTAKRKNHHATHSWQTHGYYGGGGGGYGGGGGGF